MESIWRQSATSEVLKQSLAPGPMSHQPQLLSPLDLGQGATHTRMCLAVLKATFSTENRAAAFGGQGSNSWLS